MKIINILDKLVEIYDNPKNIVEYIFGVFMLIIFVLFISYCIIKLGDFHKKI